MTTQITFIDTFQSAHHLPRTPDWHKCHRVHGHTYEVRLVLSGEVDPDSGWLCGLDFDVIRSWWGDVRELIDHRLLNDVAGLENPTVEVLARWLFEQLMSVKQYDPVGKRTIEAMPLASVRVGENGYSFATYFAGGSA